MMTLRYSVHILDSQPGLAAALRIGLTRSVVQYIQSVSYNTNYCLFSSSLVFLVPCFLCFVTVLTPECRIFTACTCTMQMYLQTLVNMHHVCATVSCIIYIHVHAQFYISFLVHRKSYSHGVKNDRSKKCGCYGWFLSVSNSLATIPRTTKQRLRIRDLPHEDPGTYSSHIG